MPSLYSFVFPATKSYLSEARPLLRSLTKWHPEIDVHILTTDLKYEDFSDIRQERLTVYSVPEFPEFKDKPNYEFRRVRTYRYKYAVEIAEEKGYKVACILDADMAMVRPVTKFFRMAETGVMLIGCNNTLLRYRAKDFVPFKIDVDPDIDVIQPTFCSVPVFVNPVVQKEYLLEIWSGYTGNDLEANNLIAIKMGKMPEIFHLSSHLWLNIHHTMLKPELHVINTSDGLYSHQGEPVFMLHGHLGDQRYIDALIEPMIKNYNHIPNAVNTAKNCINDMVKEYNKYKDQT